MSDAGSNPRGNRRGDGAITRLLGEQCATGGPFALLRLTPETCTDDSIIAALDAQLTALASHPECDTPEADEARLALHAGAAQLLDEKVRAYLVTNWRAAHPDEPSQPLPVHRPTSRSTTGRSRDQLALEHDAILTLGLYGGWNKRSLRRLVSLAHARGMDSSQVAKTLHSLSSRRPRPAQKPPAAPRQKKPQPTRPPKPMSPQQQAAAAMRSAEEAHRKLEPTPEEDPPGSDLRALWMTIGIIAVMGLVIGIIAAVVIIANPGRSNQGAPPIANVNPPTDVDTTKPTRPPTDAGADPSVTTSDPGLITLTQRASSAPILIARATTGLSLDPLEAVEQFESSVGALMNTWPKVPADTRVAAQHEIIEFLYRSGAQPAITARALSVITEGVAPLQEPQLLSQDDVWSAVWAAGMLTRLSSETDLSGTVRQRIAGDLINALRERRVVREQSFRAGALAAMEVMTDAFSRGQTGDSFPWARWADAATALTESNERAHEAQMLDALQLVLIDGGEPNDDQGAFDAIRLFSARVPWRSGDESRRRLLAWFLDERITNADMHAVTSTLARESSASGVDVTMVLPLLASDQVRQQLRGRYALAWGMTGGVDRQTVAAELGDAARDALGDLSGDSMPSDYLRVAVRLSRLSEAIGWAWRGRSQEADELLAGLEDHLNVTASAGARRSGTAIDRHSPDGAGAGSTWSERYLTAKQRVPVRLDLLDQLASMEIPDSVAAELLVRDALRGTPARVRSRAQEIVMDHGTDAAIANAVLEELPTMPRTSDNANLIEMITVTVLPDMTSADWSFQARRALVEHLLEILSADGEFAVIDDLVHELTTSYLGRASRSPMVGPDRESTGRADAAAVASMLFRNLRSSLDRAIANRTSSLDADAADRRRTGRLELASGPIQQFAANQVSICEVMAIAVAAEYPASAPDVKAVVEDMTDQRRRATNVFQQIHAVEQAMLKLWVIRIGEPAS